MIDKMLEKISERLPIDVFNAVKSLRTRRQEMVQGNVRHPMFFVAISISQGRFRLQAQYAFIYVALLEAVLCGNTQIPVQSLRSAFSKLSKKDSKGRCGFECQYLVRRIPSLSMHFNDIRMYLLFRSWRRLVLTLVRRPCASPGFVQVRRRKTDIWTLFRVISI